MHYTWIAALSLVSTSFGHAACRDFSGSYTCVITSPHEKTRTEKRRVQQTTSKLEIFDPEATAAATLLNSFNLDGPSQTVETILDVEVDVTWDVTCKNDELVATSRPVFDISIDTRFTKTPEGYKRSSTDFGNEVQTTDCKHE